MRDISFVIAIVLAAAVALGFVANCQKNKDTVDAEIRKARIEKGLEK